jgi:hypothetical protein
VISADRFTLRYRIPVAQPSGGARATLATVPTNIADATPAGAPA